MLFSSRLWHLGPVLGRAAPLPATTPLLRTAPSLATTPPHRVRVHPRLGRQSQATSPRREALGPVGLWMHPTSGPRHCSASRCRGWLAGGTRLGPITAGSVSRAATQNTRVAARADPRSWTCRLSDPRGSSFTSGHGSRQARNPRQSIAVIGLLPLRSVISQPLSGRVHDSRGRHRRRMCTVA